MTDAELLSLLIGVIVGMPVGALIGYLLIDARHWWWADILVVIVAALFALGIFAATQCSVFYVTGYGHCMKVR